MRKDDFEIIDLDNTSEFFFDKEDTSEIRITDEFNADDMADLTEQETEQEAEPVTEEVSDPAEDVLPDEAPVKKRLIRTAGYADAMYEEAPARERKTPETRRQAEHKAEPHRTEARRPVQSSHAPRKAEAYKTESRRAEQYRPTEHKTEARRPVQSSHAPRKAEAYKTEARRAEQYRPTEHKTEARRQAEYKTESRRSERNRSASRRSGSARRDARRGSSGGNNRFMNLSGLDWLVAVTGVAVLIVAIVVVNIYANARTQNNKIAAFASIGDELSGIGTAGEGILYAMADGRDMTVTEEEEEDDVPVIPEYDEKDDEESGTVNVSINLQSVVKDLKIKFVNKKTGKLIAGIAFKANVTDANKKTTTYTDDDKDGVIYIAKMQHGEAKVKLVALDGYPNYKFDSSEQKINVKETLEYKKIDVTDEIKKESQVNVAAEDTAQQTQVEAVLTDTVEWVESTKTPTGTETTYKEVKASEIAKPETVSGIDKIDYIYYRYVQYTGNTWVPVVHAEEDDEEGVTEGAAPTETETETESESESESKSEEQSETETETEAPPTQEPTKEVKPTPTPSPKVTSAPTEAPAPVATPTPTKGGQKRSNSDTCKGHYSHDQADRTGKG